MFTSILKANPYHDAKGRFARASGAASIHDASLKPTAKVIAAIRKRLTSEEIATIDSFDRAMGGKKTTAQLHRKNGEWSHERVKLHKQIVEDIMAGHEQFLPKKGEKPTLVILGGRGGSGKSKLTDGTLGLFDSKRMMVLDPDEIKKKLPGYNGHNAGLYHEESSHIADAVIQHMVDKKVNFVNDITMRSKQSAEDTMNWAEMHGYRLEGHYMHLPLEEAGVRAAKRALKKEEPRYVPLDIIAGNTHNEANFRQLTKRFDKWTIHSNEVKQGQKPFLLEKGGSK